MIDSLSLPLISGSSLTRPSPSYSLLAALPEAFLAAHGILMASLQIGPTDTLLVQGGSSAVGLAIACLAKNICGLKEVIGTTRSKDKTTRMEAAGYSTIIVLPRHQTELPVTSELSEMIKTKGGHPSGFTAIVDLVGATNVPVSLLCARQVGGSKVCMAGMLNGAYHFQQPFSPMSIVSA
jgi:NADPH:quinone reductase-like Zn-dependent oxidoreductase